MSIFLKGLVCDLLNGAAPMRRTMGKRVRRPATVDWNSVLKELPVSFTIDDIVKRGAVKTKLRVYVRQVLVRWVNQGKIKRVTRGRYQKAA